MYILTGGVLINQNDESCDIPKPLIIALEELGEVTSQVIETLKMAGYSEHDYRGMYVTLSVTPLV